MKVSMQTEKDRLARTVGLREVTAPELEDVDRRRAQLWVLSLLVGLAVPVGILLMGVDVLPREVLDLLDTRTVRLVLVGMLVVVFGYVAEREMALRRLTTLLVDERVLTASLVARVNELDRLLEASRAMNSTLELPSVLDVILSSAYGLLQASEGSIMLLCQDDPGQLEVVAVRGSSMATRGHRQQIGHGLAGQVARTREALLVQGHHELSSGQHDLGSALVVPMELRGELVGVLNLAMSSDREPFNEFHLRSVAVFADTAAAAINNARAHQTMEQTVQTLSELDRMKNEFLALVTHELRTPLTAMIGIAGTIRKGAERLSAAQIADLAQLAREQGWRLDRLVDDLLQTARGQQGHITLRPRQVDAGQVVRNAVESMQQGVRDHRVSVSVPPQPIDRFIDPDALARIVTNLVGNAAKHTPAGTSIDVVLLPRGDGVAVTVVDDGPGIPAEEREHVFGKFRQGVVDDGKPREGLGLGLFIVRSLAEAHGGSAALHEAPTGGCRFVVTIAEQPAADDGTPAPPAASVRQAS
jgi:two-component system, OmpR family, sensor histidine kinase KdpD